MKYLILVSHGGLAEGLKSSLSMFASDKVDDVIAIGLKDGESLADFSVDVKNAIESLNENDSVLVLADIVGGSPLTTVATVLEEFGKLENATILGGMNLTMALTAVVMKDILAGSELVSTILNLQLNHQLMDAPKYSYQYWIPPYLASMLNLQTILKELLESKKFPSFCLLISLLKSKFWFKITPIANRYIW